MIKKTAFKIANFVNKNKATILTYVGVVGVVGTVISAIKDTSTATKILEEKQAECGSELTVPEKVKYATPCYISTMLMGAGSILCILSGNHIHRNTEVQLRSAYALISQSYQNYRNTLIDLHGEEADLEVRNEMIRKYCDFHPTDLNIPDQKTRFYEPISNRIFYRYEREIMDAEYHINRNFTLGMGITVNYWLSFLGLDPIDGGDEIGWAVADDLYWLDFEHRLLEDGPGGEPCVVIECLIEPSPELLEGDWP